MLNNHGKVKAHKVLSCGTFLFDFCIHPKLNVKTLSLAVVSVPHSLSHPPPIYASFLPISLKCGAIFLEHAAQVHQFPWPVVTGIKINEIRSQSTFFNTNSTLRLDVLLVRA